MSEQADKRVHDYKAAVKTLLLCVEGLESGYKFDDGLAKAKIKSLKELPRCLKVRRTPWLKPCKAFKGFTPLIVFILNFLIFP